MPVSTRPLGVIPPDGAPVEHRAITRPEHVADRPERLCAVRGKIAWIAGNACL
jgi:hypothetical protein